MPADDHASATLLSQLKLSPGPGGAPRQDSSVEYSLDGVQYSAWSGAPSGIAPAAPQTLRLVADSAHQMAYAAFSLVPQSADFASLPKRLHLDVATAQAPDSAAPLPLQYYVGVANYSDSRWDWLGPFNSNYEPLINSAGQRSRYFDLSGVTTVLVAIAAEPDGSARAVDLRRVGWSTDDTYYPVRPYRVPFSPANLNSSLEAVYPDQIPVYFTAARNTVHLDTASAVSPNPFQSYGFTSVTVYRRDPGAAALAELGTADVASPDPGSIDYLDPPELTTAPVSLIPGQTVGYAVRLGNAAGETELSDAAGLTTIFAVPQILSITPGVGAISMQWQFQAGLTSYEVWRDGVLLSSLDPYTYDYTDFAAQPGTQYTYTLRAVSGALTSDSLPFTATALFDTPVWTAVVPAQGSVHLEWKMQYAPASFELYRDGTLLTSLAADQRSYDDASAPPGQTVSYVLRAVLAPPDYLETSATTTAAWVWPTYWLAVGAGDGGGGQLIDLNGHPALLCGVSHDGSGSGSQVKATIAEAQLNPAGSAADWTVAEHSLPSLEPPSGQAQGLVDGHYYSTFCSFLNEPACAMHSELASFESFNVALLYRQWPGLPPLPPDSLQWLNSYAPTANVVDSLSLASVNSRLALAWRDESSLKVSYAHALVLQPAGSADWSVSEVTAGTAIESDVAEFGGQPAIVVNEGGQLSLYRAAGNNPAGPADWQHSTIVSTPTSYWTYPLFQLLGGKPALTYYDTVQQMACLAQSSSLTPAGPGDWTVTAIAPGPVKPGATRWIDYAGRPAAVYIDAAGQTWFAIASTGTPSGPGDWTRTLLDAQGAAAFPGLVLSGGQLYAAFCVDAALRTGGWYLELPPAQ